MPEYTRVARVAFGIPEETTTIRGALDYMGDVLRSRYSKKNASEMFAETYTAAQIAGGIITRDPNGAARTDTTPTGTLLEAFLASTPANGDTLRCHLINTADAAEAITLAGGVGVTISNVGQTLEQNQAALLLFRRTAANTFTLYLIGA